MKSKNEIELCLSGIETILKVEKSDGDFVDQQRIAVMEAEIDLLKWILDIKKGD